MASTQRAGTPGEGGHAPEATAPRTAPEPGLDALLHGAALLTGCTLAWLVEHTAEGPRLVARHGAPAHEAPWAHDAAAMRLATTVMAEDRVIARTDGEPVAANLVGAPLRARGRALGAMCLRRAGPTPFEPGVLQALRSLADAAVALLQAGQASSLLEADRERLADLARASGDWLWETDADGRYTWLSGGRGAAVDGFDSAAPHGEHLVDGPRLGETLVDGPLLDEAGLPREDGLRLADLLRRGEPFARALTEEGGERADASARRIVSRSATPVRGPDGRLAGWRGTARDITEPTLRNRRQRAQDDLIQQVSDQVPGVIYQFRRGADGRARFEFVNEQVTELFGVTPAELMVDSSPFYTKLHPADRDRVRLAILEREQQGNGAGPAEIEYRVLRGDGTERWLSSTSSPERQPDGSVVWRGFVADVTERKQIALALQASEARWSLAAEAAGIGVVQFDLATGDITFDARAAAAHGLGDAPGHCIATDWFAAMPEESQRAAQTAWEAALADGGQFDLRYQYRRADGSEPWLELSARVERDAQGQPQTMIGTCRDLTEQLAVEALRHDKHTAERASRAKTEFLSRVSHELRTPLNGILGFAQLMSLDRHHALADEQQRRLDGIQRSGQHLLALINDVLDIARIEQDDFAPQLRPVNVAEALAACRSMIEPLAAARGVRIRDEAPGGCWVRADGRGLEQVLMNLLSNAIKFNRAGGDVRVTVEREGDRVAVSVEDDGPGLDEHQRSQLFQPFNRLGAERQRIEGNGLGLVIARELCLAMHGELRLAGPSGHGCRFILELDADQRPLDQEDTVPSALDTMSLEPRPMRQVLYIEDEPLNIVLMEEVFRHLGGCELHTARDGAEGLALARELHPDLLLIDINLPDMTGISIIRELRADAATADLHCIALSADAMREQVDEARAAGFDGYWTKPINVTQLMRTMTATLERGRSGA